MRHILTGFGFGPIQAGLFAAEAVGSGNFDRVVIAEIDAALVDAVRDNDHRYALNVAHPSGVQVREIEGVELLNPRVEADRAALRLALAQSTEIVTALPSVDHYDRGEPAIAALIADGLLAAGPPATVVYAAENHNRAAERLEEAVRRHATDLGRPVQFLNTVIGKMSRVVTDPADIEELGLAPITPGLDRAMLVEAFNRILVTRTDLPGFRPGIEAFEEKGDLLPFEEAKLYGHNAVHLLLGFLAREKGHRMMSDVAADGELMALAREAFLLESGAALIARRGGTDDLFTPDGYRAYADDLLVRMVNPYLRDRVERVTRDPRRKLGWDDRLVGTMRIALEAGIAPHRFARAARAAANLLVEEDPDTPLKDLLQSLWSADTQNPQQTSQITNLILSADPPRGE